MYPLSAYSDSQQALIAALSDFNSNVAPNTWQT